MEDERITGGTNRFHYSDTSSLFRIWLTGRRVLGYRDIVLPSQFNHGKYKKNFAYFQTVPIDTSFHQDFPMILQGVTHLLSGNNTPTPTRTDERTFLDKREYWRTIWRNIWKYCYWSFHLWLLSFMQLDRFVYCICTERTQRITTTNTFSSSTSASVIS